MTDCFEYEILINCLLDGEITPEDRKKLEEHLSECESCREYLRDMQEMTAQLGETGLDAPAELIPNVMKAVKAEKSKKKIIRLRYYAAAAAALLVVVAAAAALPRLKGGDGVKESAVETSMPVMSGAAGGASFAFGAAKSEAGEAMADGSTMTMTFAAGNASEAEMCMESAPAASPEEPAPGAVMSIRGAAFDDSVMANGIESEPMKAAMLPEIGGREFAMYVFINGTELPESFAEELETADGETCYIVSMDEAQRIVDGGCIGVMYCASGEQLAAVIVSG